MTSAILASVGFLPFFVFLVSLSFESSDSNPLPLMLFLRGANSIGAVLLAVMFLDKKTDKLVWFKEDGTGEASGVIPLFRLASMNFYCDSSSYVATSSSISLKTPPLLDLYDYSPRADFASDLTLLSSWCSSKSISILRLFWFFF